MLQRMVDGVLGIAKESIKSFAQESFNSLVKIINGFSALVLAVLPGKTNALEAVTGWEQYPAFRAPRVPKWMEEGVSSFNKVFDFDGLDMEDESEDASETEDEDSAPSTPSTSSHRPSSRNGRSSSHRSSFRSGSVGRSNSFPKGSCFKRLFRRLTWPIRFVFRLLRITGNNPDANFAARVSAQGKGQPRTLRRSSGSSGSLKTMLHAASRHFTDMRDMAINHRPTDSRRRGVIEDLQIGVELLIESGFDYVRRWIHYFLSPWQTFKAILGQLFFPVPVENAGDNMEEVQTATLGEDDATLPTDKSFIHQPLNTDARTCEDFITALGYPYESLKVTTSDGYHLSLERIPRPGSSKVLYLQHGILDSSLGWVSSGVVGCQAFAAFDQGFDVFLGNFRGLASRDHVDRHISAQRYWNYSVNEHGTKDIPAMLDKVHELKMNELKNRKAPQDDDNLESVTSDTASTEDLPYSLCGVSHSLGGAAMLMYIVTRRLEGKPHYLKRAILLSPSGFHGDGPVACHILKYFLPVAAPFIRPFVPGLYIHTKFGRMLFNKLSRDFQNLPAVGGVVQTLASYFVGGDSSNWVGALGITHYNMDDMPGIALNVGLHLGQMMRTKRFEMFDYGSTAANKAVYGTAEPLDIGASYKVIDIPVDVVAGKKDKLIPKSMVAKHYEVLNAAGVSTSYSEFDYAHLDFTFSNKDEVLEYVLSRLQLIEPRAKSKLKRRSKPGKQTDLKLWSRTFQRDKQQYIDSMRAPTGSPSRRSVDIDDVGQQQEPSDGGTTQSLGSEENTTEESAPTSTAEEGPQHTGNSLQLSPHKEEQQQQQPPPHQLQQSMSYGEAHAVASKLVNDISKSVLPGIQMVARLKQEDSRSKTSERHLQRREEQCGGSGASGLDENLLKANGQARIARGAGSSGSDGVFDKRGSSVRQRSTSRLTNSVDTPQG